MTVTRHLNAADHIVRAQSHVPCSAQGWHDDVSSRASALYCPTRRFHLRHTSMDSHANRLDLTCFQLTLVEVPVSSAPQLISNCGHS